MSKRHSGNGLFSASTSPTTTGVFFASNSFGPHHTPCPSATTTVPPTPPTSPSTSHQRVFSGARHLSSRMPSAGGSASSSGVGSAGSGSALDLLASRGGGPSSGNGVSSSNSGGGSGVNGTSSSLALNQGGSSGSMKEYSLGGGGGASSSGVGVGIGVGDEKPVMEKGQGVKDRSCWTLFLGASALLSGFAVLAIYSMWDSPVGGATVPVHSFEYFLYCMLGGVLSGLPHTILTPVDLIKCRVQVGEYASLGEGIRSLWQESVQGRLTLAQTVGIFFRGWVPTFLGYSLQGALKFGLYELFKFLYAYHVFSYETVVNYRVLLFLFASASAELIADVSLAPWEAVKVKMQTTRTYPPHVAIVMPRMWFTEGWNAFFKGLPALWARQVPYTMMKFASFEKTVEFFYVVVLRTPKRLVGPGTQLGVSLLSGMIAGALCCVVSHPADTVVSKLNQRSDSNNNNNNNNSSSSNGGVGGGSAHASSPQSSLQFVRSLGCGELWKGIGARLIMISTLTAMQWLIYDSFKVAVGLPTTGGGGGGGGGGSPTRQPQGSGGLRYGAGALGSAPAVSGRPF